MDLLLSEGVPDFSIRVMEPVRQVFRFLGFYSFQVFDLEYDLDLFNIVAVPDFNIYSIPSLSWQLRNCSDSDYAAILGVIGHEYFHNWTGNRVTCRDWFQLSLKECLTVFRDQEFSSDMGSRMVKWIADVFAGLEPFLPYKDLIH